MVLCGWGYQWLSRILRRKIVSVRITPEGLRATLRNGSTVWAAWGDPRFALDCFVRQRPGKDPSVFYGLMWVMEPKTAGCGLTPEGMAELLAAARNHGLSVTGKSLGKAPSTLLRQEIRYPGVPTTGPAGVRPT